MPCRSSTTARARRCSWAAPSNAAGGTFLNSLAKWDGARWSDVGGGLDPSSSRVYALAVFDDGAGSALFVGGQFFTAGGTSAFNLARWDGATWSAVGGGLTGRVHALEVHDDGPGLALYAGGEFTQTIPGQPLLHIGRWSGAAWTPLGTGLEGSFFPGVHALQSTHLDGVPALYAGGKISSASGLPSVNLARWSDSRRRHAR